MSGRVVVMEQECCVIPHYNENIQEEVLYLITMCDHI